MERYLDCREILIGLHSKILDECVSSEYFNRSVEILGIVENNEIVLESEYERDVILDFNIYENIKGGISAVSEYVKKDVAMNEQEKVILNAMTETDHSLYKVIEIEKEKNFIILKDLLNDTDAVKVVDIGLSESINKNVLIYTRLLHLDEFSLTSGLGFTFSLNHKDYLMKKSHKLMKKIKSGNSSVDRFIAFFKLGRSDGQSVMLEKVNQ